MSKRKRTKRIWLFVSLMITTTLAVPAAYIWTPDVQRWVQLNRLTSDDISQREKALNYVIRRAPVDDRVMQGVFEQLDNADDPTFQQLVNALDIAGLWSNPPVPHHIWLRWVDMLASHEDIEIRIKAAQLLTDRPEFTSHERCVQTLERLVNDSSNEVRYNALFAAAELVSAPYARKLLVQIIIDAQHDTNATIAADAILLATMRGHAADAKLLTHESLLVRRAALYSRARLGEMSTDAINQIIDDDAADPVLRDFAVFCLSQRTAPEAKAKLDSIIKAIPADKLSNDNLRTLWRAILSRWVDGDLSKSEFSDLLNRWMSEAKIVEDKDALIHDVISPVIAYRLGKSAALPDTLDRLAIFESPNGGKDQKPTISLIDDSSKLLALYSAISNHENEFENLMDAFRSESATMRDLACVLAARRLPRPVLAKVINLLLNDFNDRAKMSGAILVGLTGMHPELLGKKMFNEDIWSVRQVHRLGMWMHHEEFVDGTQRINMRDAVVGYLSRDDMPASTVLLAMLHRDRQRAFEVLFNPKAIDLNLSSNAIRIGTDADAISLHELLVDGRWWHVLEPHLPEDAPRLWLWGDEQLQQFQLDLLRFWYVTHKFQLSG